MRSRLEVNEREFVASLGEEQRETEFSRALREHEFVVSVQLDPPLGGSNRGLLETARVLEESGRCGSSTSTTTRPRAPA